MRALLALGLLTTVSCSDGYDKNDLELITAYTAKQLCSCLFVMERDEDYCRTWTRESPAVATASIDFEEKSVQSEALLVWSATARFVNERYGCVLE